MPKFNPISRLSERNQLLVLSLVVGIVVGLAAVLLKTLISLIQGGLHDAFEEVLGGTLYYLVLPGVGMLLAMLFMSSYGVQYYFLGLYFQQVLGWSPLQAGLAFVLPTIVCTIGIRFAERGLARHSVRVVLLAGWTAGLLGMVWTAAVLPLCLAGVPEL